MTSTAEGTAETTATVPVSIRASHPPDAGHPGTTLCHAPGMNLYLFANGDLGPCCRNRAYGNIADTSLRDVWRSDLRADLEDQLAAGRFPASCDLCQAEHQAEGREQSFSASFDAWRAEFDEDPTPGDGPERIEFELSNQCNLACVQCNGDLSSTIRHRREHRDRLPMPYGDSFLEELRSMVPGLRRASFVGGEPFLIPIYDEIWRMVEELAPALPCVIVTNGTVWNDRVDQVMQRLDVAPFVSIDAMSEATYRAVRVGGDLERVLDHLDRFQRRAQEHGRIATVVFCVMPENVLELPDLLLHAEARGIAVTTSIVREPARYSVAHLPATRRTELLCLLEQRDAEMTAGLQLNLPTWQAELERFRAWGPDAADGDHWAVAGPRILMFRRQGEGATDIEGPLAALRRHAGDGRIHTLRIGSGDRAGDCTDELAALLGVRAADVEGRTLDVLQPRFRRYTVLDSTSDRYEVSIELVDRSVRLLMVPVRGADGWADEVLAAFAFAEVAT